MSMYGASPNGIPMSDGQAPKANQACTTCRKQKRKCNKALPACGLCERMNRHCDYSDSAPIPTSEDFNALRMKLMELESRLNGGNGVIPPTPFATATPSSTSEALGGPIPPYSPQQDNQTHWHGVQNRFPAIAFLDKESFTYGGYARPMADCNISMGLIEARIHIPKPSIEIPIDVLDLLGDGPSVQGVITEYFATVHKWVPVISQKRMTRNMANPLWDAGPDLALLFLCMKLIILRPQDGIESSQNPVYISAKRFVALLEMNGATTLIILQANLLVMWYEYGHSIYPAAWMTAGWCVRYGNLLGINNHAQALQILGRPDTWTEKEERRRTWWGVQIADRIVSVGSQGYIMNSQEPVDDDALPVNDPSWDEGDMSSSTQVLLSTSIDEPVAPFPRLCQASVMMGK
ncbi:Depudecin biosynthesis cluster-specific transcription activator, partial [Lachnellula suecica]